MSAEEKIFIFDYYSLEGSDLDKWLDNFFWPVSRDTTTQISLDFFRKHCDLINYYKHHTFESDCLLIALGITKSLIEVTNYSYLIKILEKKGYSIKYNKKLRLIPMLLGDRELSFYPDKIFRDKNNTLNLIKLFVKSVIYNFNNKRYFFFSHFSKNKRLFAFENANVIDRNFTKNNEKWVRLTNLCEWGLSTTDNHESLGDKEKKIFQEFANSYLDFIILYTHSKFDLELSKDLIEKIYTYIIQTLSNISIMYKRIIKKIEDKKVGSILTSTAGKTEIRMISLAIKRLGGEVVGFPHGFYISHYSSPRYSFHELATVDKFVSYTSSSKLLMERNKNINPIPRDNNVTILQDNSDTLLQRWNKWKNRPLATKINTIMVLELIFVPEGAGFYVPSTMVNYHLYYNLCKTMTSWGFKVIFKKRPKSLGWDGFNIFKKMPNVEIVDTNFEDDSIIEMADAFMIQYAMSSTLYWTMCTNKTVIYLDGGWEPWFNDVYESMAKRCRVLPVKYDINNKPTFSKPDLFKILNKKPETPNTEFLQKYLFP
ncbi:MAG: hypothetical protein HQK51_06245 [Oligoflexia bacterium]|nr:hypothetical protein [Oligoflexia bacterium]